MSFKDLTGQRFGNLVVIEQTALRASNGSVKWRCKCDCGKEKITAAKNLTSGKVKSCGCLNCKTKNAKHGLSDTKLYSIWNAMMSRCYNNNSKSYERYGGRGITVCDEWQNPKAFVEWSIKNGYKDGLTIDRKDNDGNYEPSNCRWVTRKVQMNNYSRNHLLTYNGKTKTVRQWADEVGIKYTTLLMRINKLHWSVEQAMRK